MVPAAGSPPARQDRRAFRFDSPRCVFCCSNNFLCWSWRKASSSCSYIAKRRCCLFCDGLVVTCSPEELEGSLEVCFRWNSERTSTCRLSCFRFAMSSCGCDPSTNEGDELVTLSTVGSSSQLSLAMSSQVSLTSGNRQCA